MENQLLHQYLPITRIHFKDGGQIYFEDMREGDDDEVALLVISSMFLKYPPNFKISPSPSDEGSLEGIVSDQKTLKTFFNTWEGFKKSKMDLVKIENRNFPVTPAGVKRLELDLDRFKL